MEIFLVNELFMS